MESIILVMSLMGSVMLVLYFIIRPICGKNFSVGWKYRMLKISMFFFIMPVPELKSPIMRGLYTAQEKTIFRYNSPQNLKLDRAIRIYSEELLTLPVSKTVMTIFMIVWFIGFSIFLIWHIYSYIKIKRYMLKNSISVSDKRILNLISASKDKLGIKRKIVTLRSPNVNSPVTMGFFTAMIILPDMKFEDEKLCLILEHELIHIKHNDFLFRLCGVFISALHWYNPLSYILLREVGTICEYACDESVVINLNERQRNLYSHTILDMSANNILDKRPGKVLINSFGNYNKKAMKERLSNMKSIKKSKTSTRVLSAVIGVAMTMLSIMTVFAYEEPMRISDNVQAAESSEMVSAMFVKRDGGLQLSAKNENIHVVGVAEYFVNEDEKMRNISNINHGDNKAFCIHEYEAGDYIRHTKNSNGSCKEEYYDAKFCVYCNRLVIGSKTNTVTYAVCVH